MTLYNIMLLLSLFVYKAIDGKMTEIGKKKSTTLVSLGVNDGLQRMGLVKSY